jgi:hypothetical protein
MGVERANALRGVRGRATRNRGLIKQNAVLRFIADRRSIRWESPHQSRLCKSCQLPPQGEAKRTPFATVSLRT